MARHGQVVVDSTPQWIGGYFNGEGSGSNPLFENTLWPGGGHRANRQGAKFAKTWMVPPVLEWSPTPKNLGVLGALAVQSLGRGPRTSWGAARKPGQTSAERHKSRVGRIFLGFGLQASGFRLQP